MIQPLENIPFKDEKDKLDFLISLGFSSKNIQNLLYKGLYTKEIINVDVVGRTKINDVVIIINNEQHVIHPSYLLDMQKKDFIFKEKQEDNKKQNTLKRNKNINENQTSLF